MTTSDWGGQVVDLGSLSDAPERTEEEYDGATKTVSSLLLLLFWCLNHIKRHESEHEINALLSNIKHWTLHCTGIHHDVTLCDAMWRGP